MVLAFNVSYALVSNLLGLMSFILNRFFSTRADYVYDSFMTFKSSSHINVI